MIQIANVFSTAGGASADGGRYSIHDLLADAIHDDYWKGQGTFAIVTQQ